MSGRGTTSVYLSFLEDQETGATAPDGTICPDTGNQPDALPANGDAAATLSACVLGIALAAVLAILVLARSRKDKALEGRMQMMARRCSNDKAQTPPSRNAGLKLAACILAAGIIFTFALSPTAPAYGSEPHSDPPGQDAGFIPTPDSARCEPSEESDRSLGPMTSARAVSWAHPANGVYRINNTYRTANLVGRNTSDDYAYVYLGIGDGDCFFHVKKQSSDGWYTIQALHNGTYLKAWESSTGVFGNPGTWFVSSTSDYTYWAFQNGGYGGGLGISNKVWGNGNYLDIVGTHDGYYDNRVNLSSYASCPDASGRGWKLEEIPFKGSLALKGTAQEGKRITATVSSSSYKVGTVICTWYKGNKPGAKTTRLARHTLKPGTDSLTLPKGCAGSYITCVLSDDQYRGTVVKSIGPVTEAPRIAISATQLCSGALNGDGTVEFPNISVSNDSNRAIEITRLSFAPTEDMPQCTIRILHNGNAIAETKPEGSITIEEPIRMEIGETAAFEIESLGDWEPPNTDSGITLEEFIDRHEGETLFLVTFTALAANPP